MPSSDQNTYKKFNASVREPTIKFANSPPCACCGSTGQKP